MNKIFEDYPEWVGRTSEVNSLSCPFHASPHAPSGANPARPLPCLHLRLLCSSVPRHCFSSTLPIPQFPRVFLVNFLICDSSLH